MKKVFISYSWDSESHKDWVVMLAEQLERDPRLSLQLDRWDLKPGVTLAEYMEKIASADLCIVVGTPSYAAKANKRSAGVGYEAQIITSEIFSDNKKIKFIPIIRGGDFQKSLPIFLRGRLSIDFTDDSVFEQSLEELFRALLDMPAYTPPVKGPPNYFRSRQHSRPVLENNVSITVSTMRPEDARFGVTLGFALGRLLIINSLTDEKELKIIQEKILTEVKKMLSQREDLGIVLDVEKFGINIVDDILCCFSITNTRVHAAVLTGIGSLCLAYSRASFPDENGKNIRNFALHSILQIDSRVIQEKNELFNALDASVSLEISDVCGIFASVIK